MNKPPPYNEKSANSIPWHTTFVGQHMQHNFWLYKVVDDIMMKNPQISSIIEIGTGYGALTTVFGLWGIKRNIPVLTIDRDKRYNEQIFDRLGIKTICDDEFSAAVEQQILQTINNKPTWIYCDGGCKRDEFLKFAPQTPRESIISAHDLNMEFREDIDAISLIPHIVVPYERELWTDLNVQLGIFKRV